MAKRFRIALLLALLACSGGWHWFEPAARKVAKGMEDFANSQYDQALDAFVSAKGNAPQSELLRYNTAAALLRMDKHKEALQELEQIKGEEELGASAGLHYNKGNAHFNLQEFTQALEEYKKSMRADPLDLQAKRNFELTLKKIKEQQNQQNSRNQEQQNEPQQDPNKDTMDYLNQKEREQQKKQRNRQAVMLGREKDW